MTTISKSNVAATNQSKKKSKKKKSSSETKRYRLRIQIRPCVLYLVFTIPCLLLLLEHYIDDYITYNHISVVVSDTWYDLIGQQQQDSE